jgi:hypothetical protein
MIERKIEDIFGEEQFGSRSGREIRNAVGMLRIISERTLDTDEKLYACCIDWQKAFDRVSGIKLMQSLRKLVLMERENIDPLIVCGSDF